MRCSQGRIDVWLQALLDCAPLMRKFYEADALMMQPAARQRLLDLVRRIALLPFALEVGS